MIDVPDAIDVLIIGAGPTGLALAGELRRQGVDALVIEKHAEGANTSRAAVVHARTLEILEPLGATPLLLAEGIKVPVFRVREGGKTLATVTFDHLPSAYPFTLMIPQDRTEAVLLSRLKALGGDVLRPAEAVAIRPEADHAEVDIVRDGVTKTITAKWVVGCDGARSLAREAAGVDFHGGTYDQDFVLADVHMAWPISRDEVTLFFSLEGFVMVAPLPGAPDRYRIVATSDALPEALDTAFVQEMLDVRGTGVGEAQVRETVWASRFHIHHRVVSTPRAGRILLCGDAAHLHSPAGGQGMNTGIQDAVTLATPLAEALRSGSETGIEAWAPARHEVAKKVVGLTDKMTRVAALSSTTGRMVRNAALSFVGHFPAAREALARELAELDNA
ncbi:FAD-dependent oxidoreductase [Aquabacter sp. CN5-332]|uniref:FAD-dependent oxidoreductase n=1 Tax=Aquabacter sp. CN5-332 TaxID=3156608 RepID=UPI0032B4BB2C